MTKFGSKTVLPGLLLLLALPACGPAPDGDARSDSPLANGEIWRWTSLTGADAFEVEEPGRCTLEFLSSGRYVLRADCNQGSGTYAASGNKLTMGPGPLTMVACEPGSLGDRYAALLAQASGFVLEGDRLVLELGEGAGSMTFEAMKRIALAGSSWRGRGFDNGKGGMVSVAAGTTLYAKFSEDGVVSGSAGCNNFTGSYEVDGQALGMGPAAVTRKMCMGDGIMEQESAFLAALASAATWEIRGERLQLRTAENSLALALVAAVSE